MTVRFRTEPEASAELDDAVAWYERHRTGLGGEFLEAIDDTLDFIARWPRAATLASGVPGDLGVRCAPVRRFPYHVVYVEGAGTIRILAFAHDRRSPGYWLSRAME